MSMPTIDIKPINKGDAINCILASSALCAAAIAHILNAEGEKIQYVCAKIPDITIDKLIELNKSVGEVIAGAAEMENAMQRKLSALDPNPPKPPTP